MLSLRATDRQGHRKCPACHFDMLAMDIAQKACAGD